MSHTAACAKLYGTFIWPGAPRDGDGRRRDQANGNRWQSRAHARQELPRQMSQPPLAGLQPYDRRTGLAGAQATIVQHPHRASARAAATAPDPDGPTYRLSRARTAVLSRRRAPVLTAGSCVQSRQPVHMVASDMCYGITEYGALLANSDE